MFPTTCAEDGVAEEGKAGRHSMPSSKRRCFPASAARFARNIHTDTGVTDVPRWLRALRLTHGHDSREQPARIPFRGGGGEEMGLVNDHIYTNYEQL